MTEQLYTAQLQAGAGIVAESRVLLDLWEEGMSPMALSNAALESGQFPSVSARRLRNLVLEGFAPRFLIDEGRPATQLKMLSGPLQSRELEQLMFLFTCRANAILADFVRDVYWPVYAAGRTEISNDETRRFVARASQEHKTVTPWSEGTIKRVAPYITRTLSDFGLLERGVSKSRRILPFRLEPRGAIVLAYDLHFSGLGDNAVVQHPDWQLFGLAPADVLGELKRLSRKGLFIVQQAGDLIRITWNKDTIEELAHALA